MHFRIEDELKTMTWKIVYRSYFFYFLFKIWKCLQNAHETLVLSISLFIYRIELYKILRWWPIKLSEAYRAE